MAARRVPQVIVVFAKDLFRIFHVFLFLALNPLCTVEVGIRLGGNPPRSSCSEREMQARQAAPAILMMNCEASAARSPITNSKYAFRSFIAKREPPYSIIYDTSTGHKQNVSNT